MNTNWRSEFCCGGSATVRLFRLTGIYLPLTNGLLINPHYKILGVIAGP